MNTPFVRTILFVVTFIAVVVLPWWLTTVILIALTVYFPLYLEILFFGFLFDTLYSPDYGFPYIGLTLGTVFLLAVTFIKTRIRT